ncbi:MAG: M48 family metalloprotease [Rhodospirillaceae bacterium]|nr:M48 family metalloprotease [Rhodospirillales bacterium]
MISRRAFNAGLCTCLSGALTACVTHQTGPTTGMADVPVGYRPNPASDEAGLWMALDKVEKVVKVAQARIRDKAINELISGMMCRLTGDHCGDIRSYVMRVPLFNANCAPNGAVQVYSGLLLRSSSESQVAAILGHEFGHFLKRHSLQRMRDARDRGDFMAFFSLASGVSLNNLAMMLAKLGQMHFTRDHEREADSVGLQLMADAGYDPFAAAEMWKRLIAEREAGDVEENFDVFTSTHPAPSERIETLTRLAEQRGRPKNPAPDRLAEALAPIRGILLADEINLGHFKQTKKLLDLLLADGRNPGEILHYKGELHRRRGTGGDEAIALGFYHEACESVGAPPESFRQVGLMRWRRGEKQQAREYFHRYLTVKPDAGDREMIKSYLMGA